MKMLKITKKVIKKLSELSSLIIGVLFGIALILWLGVVTLYKELRGPLEW